MSCDQCRAARETSGHHRLFNSRGCVFCAARLIQKIQRLERPRDEIKARCKAALDDSVAAGFDEGEIRKLAAGKSMAVEPEPEKGAKK